MSYKIIDVFRSVLTLDILSPLLKCSLENSLTAIFLWSGLRHYGVLGRHAAPFWDVVRAPTQPLLIQCT